jgi:hypothetical protein
VIRKNCVMRGGLKLIFVMQLAQHRLLAQHETPAI